MTDHPEHDKWPDAFNTIASAAQLQALGQITLMYNYLEEGIGNLFKKTMPTDETFSEKLYHKLNNRDRTDLLTAIINKSDRDADIKEAILYLLDCYNICTGNRNILLHAILEGADADILSFSKKASRDPGRENQFRIPLADLRLVADQMSQAVLYAMRIYTTISAREAPRPPATPTKGFLGEAASNLHRVMKAFETLPDKPSKPRSLIPYGPQKEGEYPAQSS
jgi:hypothetical protein